jgi:hypothetical protein
MSGRLGLLGRAWRTIAEPGLASENANQALIKPCSWRVHHNDASCITMMHIAFMGENHLRTGVTVRLPSDVRDRIQRVAAAEHRSIAGYLEMLIERDLQARAEAERVIHVFTVPELRGEPPGTLVREDDETEDRYVRRADTLRTLLGG